MEVEETKVTSKYQTTIPRRIRRVLKVKRSGKVVWHLVKGMVIVDVHKKIGNPVEVLTSGVKLSLDAVKLVREARDDFE